MKLFYSPTSPYVRKVMVLLHETGQLGDVELLDSVTSPIDTNPALKAKNPLGKVPALERVDGPTLFDSRVICRYFDARGDHGLYPNGEAQFATLTLEAMADGILDAALLMTYEVRLRPEDKRWDQWGDMQWQKIERACAALNGMWMSHLSGPLDMGQIAVGCALGYVDFRHDARGWRAGHAALSDWYATFSSRDSMVKTRPPES
ncbi:MAG: glutathione S-transferase [Arenibacterium sp.]